MAVVRLKGINRVRKKLADGSVAVYYYHRASGKRLEGEPGTPEFMRSFRTAERPTPRDAALFGDLIEGYKSSPQFTKLAEKTKKDYRRYLDMLSAEFGTLPIAALNDPRMRGDFLDWRDKMAGTERTADYVMTVAGRVLSWSLDRGKIQFNCLARFGRIYESDRSEIIWLPEHMERFIAVAYDEISLAVVFGYYLGQRESDLIKLGPQHYRNGWMTFRQGKSKTPISIPVHADLRPIIEAMPRDRMVYLLSRSGKPWKVDHFRHEIRKHVVKAGLHEVVIPEAGDDPVSLHFHDLRGTAITAFAQEGTPTLEIASYTGHSPEHVEAILKRYTGRKKALALSAIRRLENANRTNFANRLQTGNAGRRRNQPK